MSRTYLIDEIDPDESLDNVLQPGDRLRIPMAFCDAMSVDIGKHFADSPLRRKSPNFGNLDSARVTDSNGRTGFNKPGWRKIADNAALDAVEQAHTEYRHWLVNAWRGTDADNSNQLTGAGSRGPIGAREGDQCTIDGAPGHLHRDGGKLVCVPDRRSRDAMEDARAVAYSDYENWLRNAWRNP
jgi:hypothetical protein